MIPMKVGLLADRAKVEFELGNPSVSLNALARALRLADSMPVDRGLSERWCWIALAQTLKWLWCRAEGPDWREPVEIPYGLCSDPDPRDECKEWKVTGSLVCWYVLATAEQALGLGQEALVEVRRQTATLFLPGREWILTGKILFSAIRQRDLARFRESVPGYLALRSRWFGYSKTVPYDDRKWGREHFTALPASEEAVIAGATNACSAFLASLIANRQFDDARPASVLLANDQWVPDGVRDLLQVFIERPSRPKDWDQSVFYWLGAFGDPDSLTPPDLYLATLTIWQWLPRCEFRAAVESSLGEFLSARWERIVTEQSFALKRPRHTVPAILASAHDSRSGRARLASILVAAEDAVDVSVPAGVRQEIRDFPA
jgi:hypothetical protein